MESLNCKRERQLENYSKSQLIKICLLSYNTYKVKVASCLASEISINFVLKIITVFNGSGDIQRQKRPIQNHRLLQTDILRQNYIFMAHIDDQYNWFSAGSILLLRNKFVSQIVELTRYTGYHELYPLNILLMNINYVTSVRLYERILVVQNYQIFLLNKYMNLSSNDQQNAKQIQSSTQ
ncbi:Hypothetical_protein [Hexamita inflata]|uniref:Hypothetical_protein n=1 Tax=Hexamita inflata TaxID=28002 RepID=A0AA86NVV0_9EUKA|nr:Hypothetical protein HINF_LOCUS14018 [Hexamita inflata]